MKLLKNILNRQPNNPNVILHWLYWLEDYCFGRDCDECLYFAHSKEEIDCKIHQIYRKAFPNSVYVFPACWNLPSSSIEKIQPPNLDFIARVKWSKDGFPDVRGDENEIIRSID